jgi:hypothetical protein
MESRLLRLVVRASILFVLSMVLVLGFWEHRNFYQFGLPVLLVGGGLVTFLVILAFRVALSGRFPHGWASGDIVLSESEETGLRRGMVRSLIRDAEDPNLPLVGSVVQGRFDSGAAASRLKILDGRRAPLADVTDEEARSAGYRSASELSQGMGAVHPRDPVAIYQVTRIGGPHD